MVTLKTEGHGEVNINPNQECFNHRQLVTMTATPEEGWEFVRWEGRDGFTSTANPLEDRVTFSWETTAVFARVDGGSGGDGDNGDWDNGCDRDHLLTYEAVGEGTVTYDPGPCVDDGETVTRTAVADDGWEFSHWTSASGFHSTDNPFVGEVDGSWHSVANFEETDPDDGNGNGDDGNGDDPADPPSDGDWNLDESWYQANTGPRIDDLEPSGSITVTEPGTVVEGKHVTGNINIRADDVTIRDTKVVSSGRNAIVIDWPNTATIEHVEVECRPASFKTEGIAGGPVDVTHSEVRGCEDNIWISSYSTYEYNWLHSNAQTGHPDGLQAMRATDVTIHRNWVDASKAADNAAIILKSDSGPIEQVTVSENYLNGGNFTVYVRNGGHGNPTDVSVLDNRFGRDYRFGLLSLDGSHDVSGGVWHDTGDPIQ